MLAASQGRESIGAIPGRNSIRIEAEPWFKESRLVKCPEYFVGEGAYSRVYLGELRGISAAIKVLDPKFANPDIPKHLQAFHREASAWWKLKDHPNVVPLYGAGYKSWKWNGVDRNCFFMASPYMKNGDCAKYLEKEGADKMKLVIGIALGMEYLHSQEIAHADLKSGNVMVDDSGNARIADFGSVKAGNFDNTE
ncbi:hypothetical protein HDU93_009848, partial [Gonapodya sp. JEL0774]